MLCHGGRMNRSALLALTAAGLMFGVTVPLSKLALGWLDPTWLAVARFGLAAPVLALVARHSLREAATLSVAAWGALGYGAMVVLQNLGVEHTSVTHAALIFGAVPVFVAAGQRARGPRGRRAGGVGGLRGRARRRRAGRRLRRRGVAGRRRARARLRACSARR